MSKVKPEVKSAAIITHNDKTTEEPTKTTRLPLKGTTNSNTSSSTIEETSLSLSNAKGSPKANKAKIVQISSPASYKQEKALNTTTITATSTTAITSSSTTPFPSQSAAATTTATITPFSSYTTPTTSTITTLLPQKNLLKIEPFVPNLTNRPQKAIRRSYSTLSNATLKKLNNQHANKNLVKNLEIQRNTKTLTAGRVVGNNKIINNTINGLPKVLRQPTVLRRRPSLRGPINRQRSKSTSSSNSNSNRPLTAGVVLNSTPTGGTPCASPYSAIVVQQANGICHIQRNAKEQEKLPDRINYDKRGLTAIPIFENETNLRLLSLQHNLINTFHIPKTQDQLRQEEEEEQQQAPAEVETTTKEQTINCFSCKNVELNVLGKQTHQLYQNFHNGKQRMPLAITKSNVEQSQPQVVPGQLMLPLNAQPIKNPLTFGSYSYMLQRNKLLHRSINMNNCEMKNHNSKSSLQQPTQLRFGMRKSKSFVNNFNLQLNVTTKGTMQNQKNSLLRRTDALANLKSFDSSTSNITDSTQSALVAIEMDEPLVGDDEDEDVRSTTFSSLAIKNKQLIINYGNIFQNLVFLDLYDNQIERISNLDGLMSLIVLLLGKNRISDITGLSSLKSTLRVLDLHGNKLCSISNKINCLKELKSLNLAGNQIRQINHNDFMGLHNLKELNLKRNKLKRINGFQHLLALERLWLCHNDLHKVDDMSTIAKAQNLVEITIENNPLTLAGDCVSFLVSYLPKLQTLSQMPITEQVRKAAMTWRANKELSEANSNLGNKEIFNIIRREEIISNARTNWELLRSQQMMQNSIKQQKPTAHKQNATELEKIAESNENNYEEFIRLPPIESQQQQQQQFGETNNKDIEEHSSPASSLGPNVNSLSSCYSSQDEDDTGITTNKANKPPHNIDNPSSASSPSMKSNEKMENIKNHTSSADNQHQHQQSFHSFSKCNNITTTEAITTTIAAANNYTPTLNLQFPMETNRVSSNQQNQAVTSTVASVSSSTQTVTISTVSSSMTVDSPASVTLTKRYMTGSLMRTQTIVGTVTGAGGVAVGCGGGCGNGSGGYTNGYTVKTNTVATANNIRYQSKLNPNATTQTAAINTLQQTITTTAATTTTMPVTMITTTTGYSIAFATANNNDNNSLMVSSSMNGNNTSLTLNTNKTLVTGASNTITGTGIAANSTTTTSITGPCGATSTKLTAIEREREQGGDYLIEICGRYLNIYGQGALRFIDKQWNPTKANDVHTLNFSYINFNNIASILGRIKVRFVHAENFVLRETNINCLGQLNALAELQGITSLSIDEEGNPITSKNMWRSYAIYRLSHWGLKMLNNIEITAQEIEEANVIYSGLSDLILWSMPDVMLQPLLTRLRLDETCTASKLSPKQWLRKADNKSLRLVVGKEALQWKKSNTIESHILPTPQQVRYLQHQYYYNGDTLNTNISQTLTSPSGTAAALLSPNVNLTTRERGKIHFTVIMENTCNAVEKLHKLEQIWPTTLQNIVRNTLLDYSQLDVYIRNLMTEIMK